MGISTAVCTIGSNGKAAQLFLTPYAIVERIQVTVFFMQELVLSCLYGWKAWAFLHDYRRRKDTDGQVEQKFRTMMLHLILSNVAVVARMCSPLSLDICEMSWSSGAYGK